MLSPETMTTIRRLGETILAQEAVILELLAQVRDLQGALDWYDLELNKMYGYKDQDDEYGEWDEYRDI